MPNLTSLSLNLDELTLFPQELANLKYITDLNLTSGNIKTLPPQIAGLTNLTKLSLKMPELQSLPETMKNMDRLASFYISSKKISPETLEGLQNHLPGCRLNIQDQLLK
jgi:Leucine-rich repeat (LRR) protein